MTTEEHVADTSTPTTRRHRLAPAALTVLGTAAAVCSVRLGLGESARPGPGAWPVVASIGVIATGAWLTLTGVDSPEEVRGNDLLRVLAGIIAVGTFIALLPLLGMPVPAFLVLLAWLKLFGESWRLSLAAAAVGVVALQLLFVQLLAVPLPVGPLAPGR
ncbi:tripartite tricarboxylate transporter TctB family protein [Rhodococcus koreensis]|uniref:tripartite tricarboxylate transporter TctB family protein n=1 Tax=Rhodococcus koreensis TaxID=99653 RepID=UPI00366F18C4